VSEGQASFFATVPRRDYLQFWQAGLFQPQRVARFLGLNKVELAQMADIAPASVRFDDKAPKSLREHLMDVAATCELVAQAFDGNPTKTSLWFMTPNPQLGNISPVDVLRRGDREVLQRQVMRAMAGDGATLPASHRAVHSSRPTLNHGFALLEAQRNAIARLCKGFAVRSLALFGSALRTDFDPAQSDFDLAVEFAASNERSPADQYFDFKTALEKLLGRSVDLVELNAMPDSRLRRNIARTQIPIYAEAA
jgi:predicted nucleotidyltransferase